MGRGGGLICNGQDSGGHGGGLPESFPLQIRPPHKTEGLPRRLAIKLINSMDKYVFSSLHLMFVSFYLTKTEIFRGKL
jgi:hypothetical protein